MSATTGAPPPARPNAPTPITVGRTDTIGSISFQSLLFTQWLTAINDNAFRWLVVGIGKDYVDPGQEGGVLSLALACFVLPYLLLAWLAGYFADRFSKRDVIIACKIAEVAIMGLGILAIVYGDLFDLFVVVFLMGAQSALFAPSKMGTIPELLSAEKMSKANGIFNFSTVTATILGMGVGAWLSDVTGVKGREQVWISATVLVGLAAVGTVISFGIRRIPAANPRRRLPLNAFQQTFSDLNSLFQKRALFLVALGIVFYWSLGALAQLNIDQFATESGALLERDRIPLLVSLVLGVGIGSVLAGIWSGGRIELGMLSVASLGIMLFAGMLCAVPTDIFNQEPRLNGPFLQSCLLLMLLGASAGVFTVPLAAYLQHRSPLESRGSILSAANFLIFTGVLISALLFATMRLPFHKGSLDHVADELVQRDLTEQQLGQIDVITNEFRVAWLMMASTPDPVAPDLEAFLRRGDEQIRSRLLAHLLWEEFRARYARQENVIRNVYLEQCDTSDVLRPTDKMLVKAVYEQASDLPLFTARQVFLVIGLIALPMTVFVTLRLPQASARFIIWWFCQAWFRIRIRGLDNLPERAPVLMLVSRGSWFDRLLTLIVTARKVREVTWIPERDGRLRRGWDRFWGVVHIAGGPARRQERAAEARKTLRSGNVVAVFPESFSPQTASHSSIPAEALALVDGLNVPVVPLVFTDRDPFARGSSFPKLLGGLVRNFRQSITIHFGLPVPKPTEPAQLNHLVEATSIMSKTEPAPVFVPPACSFIRQAKARKWAWKASDSTGASLKGGQLLARTLVLRRLLERHVLDEDEPYVGLLLPPSLPSLATNLALAIDRRIAVNLNYTVSNDVVNACVQQCGIRHILTSRRVMEKISLKPDAELIYLEDLREKVTRTDKLKSALEAFVTPARRLEQRYRLDELNPDDSLTVIFTSGSTGQPKGVVLTQNNIASNIAAFNQVLRFQKNDVVLGVLPFFHSFGYTVSLWGAMSLDIGVAFHFNPLDAKQVGKLCQNSRGTCLLATPTFLRSYTRRCSREELKTLEIVVTGAEKLPVDVADAFEKKFGVRPVEGYGATELSPVACVNVPPARGLGGAETLTREGTVGKPLPHTEAKVLDLDTGEPMPAGQAGMLWIRGPNVMKGYLHRDDLTQEVIQDGWYKTGDVGQIDVDGFVQITGRISRFSKIGGEMVPHIPVEDALNRILKAEEDGMYKAVVTSVPDSRKGERLVVLHLKSELATDAMVAELRKCGLPNIYLPGNDAFIEIDEIPVLGTGKLDLKRAQQVALEAMKISS